jgi:Zn-finger nucleic acid-binding protein
MNCRNCGAAMVLMGARRYYFCQHCGSFHFPEPLNEGLRIVDRPEGAAPCPVCHQPLARVLVDDVHMALHCENCRGVLLERELFAEVVQRRRAWATTPPVPPEPLDKRDFDRALTCPGCSRPMTTHPYYGPGNVVMESCDSCNLVWLDHGELQQIVDAPGRDRGSRDRPARPRPSHATGRGDDDDRADPFSVLLDLLT